MVDLDLFPLVQLLATGVLAFRGFVSGSDIIKRHKWNALRVLAHKILHTMVHTFIFLTEKLLLHR